MILEDIDEEKYPEIIEEYFGGEFDKDDQFYYTKVFHRILKEIEIPLLEIALYSSAGNQAKCADMLGLNRNTLRKKINEFDIAVKRRRKLM